MKFTISAVILAVLGAGAALAQEACPTPDLLTGESVDPAEFYQRLATNEIKKGEFETTEQFEARKAAVSAPPQTLLKVDIEPDRFQYDADVEEFQLYVSSLDDLAMYRSTFEAERMKDTFGDYSYSNPVSMTVSRKKIEEREYEASNAYGASIIVTEKTYGTIVVFDHKGRKKLSSGDDLFSERSRYESVKLGIPVPLATAPDIKPGLEAVALVVPKKPYSMSISHRSEPTRDLPIDRRTRYGILFADIQCVGVRDGDGNLLAHWKTR